MNTDHKLDQILERLEKLEKLIISSTPPSRRPAELVRNIRSQHAPDKILDSRVEETIRQFIAATKVGYADKKRQGFNSAILGAAVPAVRFEIVPESILRNRCSLRKLFSPIFEAGEGHATDNATAAIDEAIARGLLYRTTVGEANVTKEPCFSRTSVLVTPKEGERITGEKIAVTEKEPDIEIDLKSEERTNTESIVGDSEDEIIDDEGFEEE